MPIVKPGRIVWQKGRTPDMALGEFISNSPTSVVVAYVAFMKRDARGHVRDTGGEHLPVDTGRLRASLKVVGRTKFKRNAKPRNAPKYIGIAAVRYAPYPDRLVYPRVTTRVWRRFLKARDRTKAEKRTARKVNRIRPKRQPTPSR